MKQKCDTQILFIVPSDIENWKWFEIAPKSNIKRSQQIYAYP